MVIRRIGIGSAAKLAAVIYALIGLLVGIVFSLISIAGFAANAENEMPPAFGALFGIGAVVIFPICYAIIGAIFISIVAAVYNVTAGMIGGLQFDVE